MEEPKSPNVYARAADLLRRDGWCQGMSHHPDGRWCLVGVLSLEAWEPNRVKTKLGILPLGSVSDWNDAPGRTLPEVLAVLDELAGEG